MLTLCHLLLHNQTGRTRIAQKFTAEDFVNALNEGTLSEAIEKHGLVKPADDDRGAIMFSEGTACENWTRIPIHMIESVTFETMIRCRDHQHPLVTLRLNRPHAENDEANVYASLLTTEPSNAAELAGAASDTAALTNLLASANLTAAAGGDEIPPIPRTIATKLARDYGVSTITGLVQCVVLLNQILSDHDRCVSGGGSATGCANIAARNIAQLACRSYCNCG